MPAPFITVVRMGKATTQAIMRVTTRYLKESTAVASRASICSVTRIAPSSAPMPAPMRPDSSKPAVSGPVSFTSARARPAGIIASAPKRSSDARVCIDSTTPTARPAMAMSGTERTPSSCNCLKRFADLVGRAEDVADAARRKNGELPAPGRRLGELIADLLEHGYDPTLRSDLTSRTPAARRLTVAARADFLLGAHDARQRHDAAIDVDGDGAQSEIGIGEQGRADGGSDASIIERDPDGADGRRGAMRARRDRSERGNEDHGPDHRELHAAGDEAAMPHQ